MDDIPKKSMVFSKMLRLQLLVLSVFQALDIITTVEGLKLGTVELNVLMQDIVGDVRSMILVKLTIMLIVGFIAWIIGRYERTEMASILMLVNGFMAAVVVLNSLAIMFMKGMI